MKAMKFDVEGRPELCAAIQERLFALGCTWRDGTKQVKLTDSFGLFVANKKISCSHCRSSLNNNPYMLATLSDLYDITTTRTITIDGKDIEVSEESFQALKKHLTEG